DRRVGDVLVVFVVQPVFERDQLGGVGLELGGELGGDGRRPRHVLGDLAAQPREVPAFGAGFVLVHGRRFDVDARMQVPGFGRFGPLGSTRVLVDILAQYPPVGSGAIDLREVDALFAGVAAGARRGEHPFVAGFGFLPAGLPLVGFGLRDGFFGFSFFLGFCFFSVFAFRLFGFFFRFGFARRFVLPFRCFFLVFFSSIEDHDDFADVGRLTGLDSDLVDRAIDWRRDIGDGLVGFDLRAHVVLLGFVTFL